MSKPKTAAKKPAASAAPAPQPAPQAEPAPAAATTGPAYPGGNPYADAQAPYKVDSSANAKLTEPIVDTPRTITTVPKEVL